MQDKYQTISCDLRPVALGRLGEFQLIVMSGGDKVRLLELHRLEKAKQVRLLFPLHECLLQLHIAFRQQNTDHPTGEIIRNYILKLRNTIKHSTFRPLSSRSCGTGMRQLCAR